MSIFEGMMLICFGIAWPVSIYNSYKARSTKGKSIVFLIITILGYLCGITHKILYNQDILLYLYILNMLMVIIDACLWIRNKRIENRTKKRYLKVETSKF